MWGSERERRPVASGAGGPVGWVCPAPSSVGSTAMCRSTRCAFTALGFLLAVPCDLPAGEPAASVETSDPKANETQGGGFGIGHLGPFELPERPRARRVPADEAELTSPEPDPVTAEIVRRDEEARQAFRRAKVIDIDESFEGTPLREVAEKLAGKLGMPVRIDEQAILDAGVQPERPVTMSFKGITLSEAFSELSERHDVAFIRVGRRVVMTSLEIADESTEVRFYPVGDLTLTTRKDGRRFHDPEPLIQLVEGATNTLWEYMDGTSGTISAHDAGGLHVLVVWQTDRVHEEIEELLYRLRSMRAAEQANSSREIS